jgi:hypothetical protein
VGEPYVAYGCVKLIQVSQMEAHDLRRGRIISDAVSKLRIAEERSVPSEQPLASHALSVAEQLQDYIRDGDENGAASLGERLTVEFKEWAENVLRYTQPRDRPVPKLGLPWQAETVSFDSAEL